MCAINGFSFKDEILVKLMNDATKHRGPDGSNTYIDDGVSLGHNRLSIIDTTEASSQPMISRDGRYVIVYNGELYNFKDIKMELGDVNFRSTGDTEVVLESYVRWGKDCLNRFNGMFAFAIWDKQEKSFFLARDHYGIKPLYYSIINNNLIFSSEIKGILAHSNVPRNISIDSLNHYLKLLYVPEPLTMFSNVLKLSQGSYAIYKNGVISVNKYSDDYIQKSRDGNKKILKNIKNTISEAVERQLISDRPVGVYLSGGIDSSVILDCMSKRHKNIKTFSIGFHLGEGEESNKYNKDIDLARETSKIYKTDHHEIFISSDDVIKSLKEVVYHMDEPISNPTACALFVLSKATKEHVDVVLCGDGGDELFAGYERYRMSYAASIYQKLPSSVTSILSRISGTFNKLSKRVWIDRYAQFMFQKEGDYKAILSPRILNSTATKDLINQNLVGSSFEEAMMNADRKTWLVDFALMLSDTMSMSHGVEARVPFLDRKVVQYALSIPTEKKLSIFTNKILLKNAFKNDLPRYLFRQPKRGFFTPAAKWLRHPDFIVLARDILSPNYSPNTSEIFNWVEVSKMLDDHISKKKYNLTIIWALITFQVWAKQYNVKI